MGDAPSTPSVTPIPLFLFSLPRSGSTLLQRMIATHPDVATGPEPTFLLPLVHIRSDTDVVATFDQRYTAMAIQDFFASTGAAQANFDAMVRAAALDAYSRAAPDGARYFLDKTPKYHMISDDILRIFPEAPAVVLWRNPLAIIASLISTWGRGGGRWNLQHFRLDLFHALPKLIDVATMNSQRTFALRYEDLVREPLDSMTKLFEHIGLDSPDIDRFGEVELVGRVQDPNAGREGFARVRSDRIDQWTTVLANPVRKAWCRRYLEWLGSERLDAMGYDSDEIAAELDAIESGTRFLASDLILVPYDTIYRVLEVGVFKKQARTLLTGGRPLLAHK